MSQSFSGPYVIEHGDVWFRETMNPKIGTGLRHVCDGSQEIAIAHDGDILLKTGSATSVEHWLDLNRAKLALMNETLMEIGTDPVEITLIRLPVSPETVNELNACLAIQGRCIHLEENLSRIGIDNPSLFQRSAIPR